MAANYGLIGFPLSHSFSERYFTEKFAREGINDATFSNFPIESIAMLRGVIKSTPNLRGFSVTMPYKEQIMPLLDSLDDAAAEIGAVNCVKVDGGTLAGYNTDAPAFEHSLLRMLECERPSALVLGTGGASKAVAYALKRLGIAFRYVSRVRRSDAFAYEDLTADVINEHKLIINTSPVGMYPNVGQIPTLPYEAIGEEHFLFDLVYNPELTEFMRLGAERGATVKNGYEMLVTQAELAWAIWNSSI